MDSQNNSFSQPPSAIDPDEARRRFLESMGISVPASGPTPARSAQPGSVENTEEGVVLSSAPDDLDLPGASSSEPARARVVSFQAEEKAEDAISIPVGEKEVKEATASEVEEPEAVVAPVESSAAEVAEPEAEVAALEAVVAPVEPAPAEEEKVVKESAENHEEPLHLHCPKCQGDLVLMPRHLGIEGACVWCETKIVAARSGSDSQVRVFPLFQPSGAEPAVAEPAAATEVEVMPVAEAAAPQVETKAPAPVAAEVKPAVDSAVAESAPAEAPVDPVSGPGNVAAQTEGGLEPPEKPETVPAWSGGFETVPDLATEERVEEAETTPAAFDFAEMPSGFGGAAPVSPEESVAIEAPEETVTEVEAEFVPEVETKSEAEAMPAGFGGFEGFSSFSGEPAGKPVEAETVELVSETEGLSLEAETEGFSSGFEGAKGFSEDFPEKIGTPVDEAPRPVDDAPRPVDDAPRPVDDAPRPVGFSNGFSSAAFPLESVQPDGDEKVGAEPVEPSVPADFSSGWAATAPAEGPVDIFSDTPSPFADAPAPGFEASTPPASNPEETVAGFSSVTNWGSSPGGEAPATTPAPEEAGEPATEQIAEPAVASESSFSSPAPSSGSSGVASSWSSSGESPVGWGGPSPDPLMPQSPSPAPAPMREPAESAGDFGSGFAIPANSADSFAVGNGPDLADDLPTFDSVFPTAGNAASAQGEASFADAVPLEDVSAAAAESGREEEFSISPAPEAAPGLFGAANPGDAGNSLFTPPAPASAAVPPPIPESASAESSSDRNGNGIFGASPMVTSQPLGSQPVKKKGKGLTVLLVILLGLVCGAALASFVLPVDEYVEKAKLFMEKKFTVESGIDPAAFLSGMVVPESGETPLPEGLSPAMEAAAAEGDSLPEVEVPPMPAPVPAPAPVLPQ